MRLYYRGQLKGAPVSSWISEVHGNLLNRTPMEVWSLVLSDIGHFGHVPEKDLVNCRKAKVRTSLRRADKPDGQHW